MGASKSTTKSYPLYRGGIGLSGTAATAGIPGWSPSLVNNPTFTNFLNGTVRSNWRQIIAQGGNATTPMSAAEYNVQSVQAYYHAYGNASKNNPVPGNDRRVYAACDLSTSHSFVMPFSSVDADAENLARVKAARRIESIMTSFQGGVFLGELRQTLRMIRNPAMGLRKGLASYLDALKKGRRGSPAQRRKFAADTWLEYAFGWAPLLNDLDEARKYLAKRRLQLDKEFVSFKAVASKANDNGHAYDQYLGGSAGLSVPIRWYRHNRRECIVVYRGAVSSKTIGTPLINASSMGLSARSFAPTLWELLPWSFLIDYFTNIGDVITSWSNLTTALAWGCRTEIKRSETKAATFGQPNGKALWQLVYEEQFVPGKYKSELKLVNRQSISSIGPPSIQFELPGFGLKWLNLAALVASGKRLQPY